jgi:hypothetical protein
MMLRELMEDLEFVERKILRLEQMLASRMDMEPPRGSAVTSPRFSTAKRASMGSARRSSLPRIVCW